MSPWIAMSIGLGGAAGALLRALVGRWIVSDFPFATLIVNCLGSFLLALAYATIPPSELAWRAFIGAGFCGALTTFSTFILEAVILLKSGQRKQAWVYVMATLVLCCLASSLGFLFIY